MRSSFFEKLIDRLDVIDPGSMQTHFLRLAGEKGLLETIFHAIQEGIIVLDQDARLTYANQAAEKLFGFRIEDAEGQPIRKYLREIDWDLIMNLDADEWSRMVSREIETHYPEHRFVAFYLVPLNLVNDDETGAVVILRDVTHERETASHTLESERLNAITLLAAGVAHEIGNPLNSLNIHLQLMERELDPLQGEQREALEELLDVARQEVERLDQIINQFLGAIRPQPPSMEPQDLSGVLQETLDFMQHEITDRGILAELETGRDLPAVQADRGQIKQAFFNLIKNAVQAMSEGGLLKLQVTATERFVAVSFQDNGPGIVPEQLGRIFEPYHTTKQEGSGLGLMIVQRIMRDHGGEIEIDSEPGKGTGITLFFPRDDRRIRLLNSRKTPAEPSEEKKS